MGANSCAGQTAANLGGETASFQSPNYLLLVGPLDEMRTMSLGGKRIPKQRTETRPSRIAQGDFVDITKGQRPLNPQLFAALVFSRQDRWPPVAGL